MIDAISILVSHEDPIRTLFRPSKWRFSHNTLGEIQYSSANLLLNTISNLFPMTEYGSRGKPLKSFEYLATTLQTFDASDPRDIIYALVSLAHDTADGRVEVGDKATETVESHSSDGKPILAIDYNKDPVEVYVDFTQFCIQSTGLLDIICRPWAKIVESHPLPSWIRSMENAEFGGPGMGIRGRKNGQSLLGSVGQPVYCASGKSGADVNFDVSGRLKAKGILLGTITRVSLRSTSGMIFRDSLEIGGWDEAKKSRTRLLHQSPRLYLANINCGQESECSKTAIMVSEGLFAQP
ncbi:HET-domain-containing protein [Penicillium malachiteum]|nr:HET-domain-containing protein [Penicillium malachiteum]